MDQLPLERILKIVE
jgi:hypothetical protein